MWRWFCMHLLWFWHVQYRPTAGCKLNVICSVELHLSLWLCASQCSICVVNTCSCALLSAVSVMFSIIDTVLFEHVLKAACSESSQRYAGVTLCGIQWIDSTVAVVISSSPHLVSQLESNSPPAEGNILSMPQVHLTAKVKHQGLDTQHTHPHTYMHNQHTKLTCKALKQVSNNKKLCRRANKRPQTSVESSREILGMEAQACSRGTSLFSTSLYTQLDSTTPCS